MLRYGQTLRWGELLGRGPRPMRPPAAVPGARRAPAEPAAVPVQRVGRSKTWLIMQQELLHVITRPWFVLLLVGLPLILFGEMFLFYRQPDRPGSSLVARTGTSQELAAAPQALGYVDQAGLIRSIPPQLPPGILIGYPDEASAQRAMVGRVIASYVVIPPDHVQTGQLTVVRWDLSPTMRSDYRWVEWLLLINLLDGDTRLAAQVWEPLSIQVQGSTPPAAADSAAQERAEEEEDWLGSLLIVLLFYAVIVMASGFLMRSVGEEKKNCTIEVLLLSASPAQILAGKTIALGLVGLLQGAGWVVLTYLLFSLGGMTFRLPGGVALPPEFPVGAAVFFLLGYAVYAGLYAGAGVLVPDWRQARGVSLLILLPALVGFEICTWTANTSHSLLMVISSIFPLTAPVVMIKRLLSGGVPLWQLLLAAVLMAGTAYWTTRAVARMFRAQNLLSGQPFSLRRYFRALLGRGV
jgi:ABC-2 type transport system permease protein